MLLYTLFAREKTVKKKNWKKMTWRVNSTYVLALYLFIRQFIFGVQRHIHTKRVLVGFLHLIRCKTTTFVKSNCAVFFG